MTSAKPRIGVGDVVRIDYPDVRYGAAFIEIYDGTEWKILCKCGKNVAREKAKSIVDTIRNFVVMSHQNDPSSWDVEPDRIGELVNAVTNMAFHIAPSHPAIERVYRAMRDLKEN